MPSRTTIVLDAATRRAAKELALRYDCSTAEAIRRAVIRHHDTVFGIPPEPRGERRQTLDRLFELFAGHDAEAEVRRLKTEDEGF